MKPTVPDDGSIQQQIGSAYDIVKSVADNLPAIIAVTGAIEDAQEVIDGITEQIEIAVEATNNANAVVATIEGLKADTIAAKDLAEEYKDESLVAKNEAVDAKNIFIPLYLDFQDKWPTFTSNYSDTLSKYNSIVIMHDDVDADRIAAEQARNKAELWANGELDVEVETGKFSAMHWAIKSSGFNTLAQGYANTANTKAIEANNSAIAAADSASTASSHATTATNKANDASAFSLAAEGHKNTALSHANTAMGFKDQAWTFREEARGYAQDAAAIVGGDFVPRSTTINGLALSGNIVLTATQLTDLVPKTTTVNSKALTSNIVLGVNDISGAARTDGSNATGTWPITSNESLRVTRIAQTSDTGSSNAAMFSKFLTVNIGTQYHEYTALVNLLIGGSGSQTPSNELLNIRVKQQLAFGQNPGVECQSMVLVTPYSGVVIGYTIVQNTPTTKVEFYIQTNNGWTVAEFVILQERISGGINSRTWHDLSPFVASVTNFVNGSRTYFQRTTDSTNKLPWNNVILPTSVSNLQTILENASVGVLKKTAANTYSIVSLVEADIPNISASKITTGTLPVSRGGTGATTLTGLVKGNGTGAFSAAVSGTDVKTVNGASLLGSGNVDVGGAVNGLLKCNGAGVYSQAVAGTDYVAPSGSITGNAATATKLATARTINGVSFDGSASITIPAPVSVASADALTTARTISATGDATWTVTFKGDDNVTSVITLSNVVTAGTGTKVTYNSKGLITGSSDLVAADIPNLDWSKITTGIPSFALQSDSRFTNSREWTAATITQAEAEAGTDTNRRAFTAQRVAQAIAARAVPLTRTVNGRALSANITLTAADLGIMTTEDINAAVGRAKLFGLLGMLR